ncbi:MAG: hypothetical protein ACRYGM_13800 [Janthinobacterium lividum]
MTRPWIVAALLSCGMLPSFVQPATAAPPAGPRLQPVRDVVVTYVVEGQVLGLLPGGIPGPVRLSWDAAGQRVRAEVTGRSQVALLDLRAHTSNAIDTTMRVVLPVPIRTTDLKPLTLEGARLTPKGKDTVAGLPCTVYSVESAGSPGTVCLTVDGVPLRGQGDFRGKPGTFKATQVSFGSLPDSLFTVPEGYMALGGLSGLLGGQGGSQGQGGGANLDLRSLGRSLLGGGR